MISSDTIAFIHSLPGAMVSTRTAGNRPTGHECYVVRCTADTFSGYIPVRFAEGLEENMADNGRIASVSSNTYGDHRSVQLKGRVTLLEPPAPRPDAIAEVEPIVVPFLQQWMSEERAVALFRQVKDEPAYYFEAAVEQVFDQTPGPKAGNSLSGGAT